jgi:hypothetical protein
MKFLCVPCDEPMRLDETAPDGGGSIRLVYACPACGYEFAMLTNAHETQVVGSLGVKLGGEKQGAGASRCPFTGVVRELEAASAPAPTVRWTTGAEARLALMPDFVRPMVQAGLERYAASHGRETVDETMMDEIGSRMGMGSAFGGGERS